MPSLTTRRPAPLRRILAGAALCGVIAPGLLAQDSGRRTDAEKAAFLRGASWARSLDAARERAKAEKKLILAYFGRADQPCPACARIESELLSSEKFGEFAGLVVPYCRLRTQDDPDYAEQLAAVRGSKAPHLAFLDERGQVLDVPREYTLRGLRDTHDALLVLRKFEEQKGAKASAVFLAKIRLNRISVAEAVGQRPRHRLSKAQDAEFREALASLEVESILSEARRSRDFASVGPRFAKMLEAGRIPPASQSARRFWSQLMAYAQARRDARLYARSYAGYRSVLSNDASHERQFARFDAILEALKSGEEIPQPTSRRSGHPDTTREH